MRFTDVFVLTNAEEFRLLWEFATAYERWVELKVSPEYALQDECKIPPYAEMIEAYARWQEWDRR